MLKRSVVLLCVAVLAGTGTAWASLNPIGTSWIPTPGVASDANPMIDTVTGNPVQSWHTLGYSALPIDQTPMSFADSIAATHDYSLYAAGKMDFFYSAYMTYKTGQSDGGNLSPRVHRSGNAFQMMSPSVTRGAAVWTFIAPQDGWYNLSGNVWVNNNNDTQNVNANGEYHPEFLDPTNPANSFAKIEAFALTGENNATYTCITKFCGPDGYMVIPDGATIYMETGDVFAISNVGGQADLAQMNQGGGTVFLNTSANSGWQYGKDHPALVTVTLVPEPATLGLLGLGIVSLIRRKRA